MSKYLARTALKRGGNSTNSSSANTSNAAGPRSSLGIFRTRVLLIGFSLVAFLIYHYTQIADVGSNELLPSHLSLRYSTYRGVAPLQSPLRRGRNESENANSDSGVEAIKQFVTSTVKAVARLVRPSGSNGNGNHTVMKGNTLLKSLPCRRSFEPTCEMYSYLRFWNKEFVESDCRQSLLRVPYNQPLPLADRKFLLFEPDRGGWNNIRMAAETAMIIAHASGRTLVLPPEERWYLLDKNKHNRLQDMSTFNTFFDFSKIAESLDVIPMKEYLTRVGLEGRLLSEMPDAALVDKLGTDPNTKWLWPFLEKTSHVRQWEPGKMYLGFNFTELKSIPDPIKLSNDSILVNPHTKKVVVLGHIKESLRTRRHASHNRKLVPYDMELDSYRSIFFPGDYRNTHRLLTHFYSYVFFADLREEHFYKRLVRDRLHYHDEIFCAAGRVLKLIHEDASRLSGLPLPMSQHSQTLGGNVNEGASFFSYHIRRGDFQYKQTRLSADEIWKNTKHLLLNGSRAHNVKMLYISTDEKKLDFFEPFWQNFTVRFLKDYYEAAGLAGLNQNHIGMIEQIICANSHTFIGTPFSTFSGYITRMRGYYRDGRYKDTYYVLPAEMYILHKQPHLKGPFWAREFAVAHRDIDDDSIQRHFGLKVVKALGEHRRLDYVPAHEDD